MFEHEQHDAWLLGRRARDTAQGVLAKRTRRIDPSPVGRPTQRATRLRISQTNTTNQRGIIPLRQVTVERYNASFWHPIPLYVWEWLEARVRVGERVRKSVVFIGAENERGFNPYGTALIGLVVYEDFANTVIITAHHVVEDIPGETISVRTNRKDGSSDARKVPKKSLIRFEDRAIDLCVFPLYLDPTIYDFFAISLQSAEWERRLKELGDPEPGDEVCAVGLYTSHYGHTRNMPVARIGHIAALPEERVATDRGHVHGYLIECQSIAGLSGSPVFWTVPTFKLRNDGQVLQRRAHFPLGILIGHHVVESTPDELIVPKFQQPPEEPWPEGVPKPKSEERRTGFAVVLPINHIFRIFESEEIMAILKKATEKTKNASGFRAASAVPAVELDHPANDANPKHREDFNSLLHAAVQKRESED